MKKYSHWLILEEHFLKPLKNSRPSQSLVKVIDERDQMWSCVDNLTAVMTPEERSKKLTEFVGSLPKVKKPAQDYDWLYAGTGFSVYTSSTPTDALGKSAIPVYCVWMDDTDFNPANGLSGGLLFTADKVEYDGLVKLVGVTGVGAVFYGEVPGN